MADGLKNYDKNFYQMHEPWKVEYFHIAEWIVNNTPGDSFGDIGCGNGYIIESLLNKFQKKVWGIDGSEEFQNFADKSIVPFIEKVDLMKKHNLQKADVAICLEVAEHLPFEASDILVENILSTGAGTLIFTAATPGQPGIDHINCQPHEFWIRKFRDLGYNLDKELSEKFVRDLDEKIVHTRWFLQNIMVFKKDEKFQKEKKSILKLIMTLLVRDEIDIIRYNIDFHLAKGVDFIIATDNGSVDGTLNVLKEYEKKGVLHLIEEPKQDYSQAEWVNRMGKIAVEKYHADFIFHCDADEFWYPKSGKLKSEICSTNKKVLMVDVTNVLLCDKNGKESFPGDTKYAVVRPFNFTNLEEDFKNSNFYLFKYPPKVIFREYLEVLQGNHDVAGVEESDKGFSEDITIYHYPVRGKKRFFQKIINGGRAYQKNKKLEKSIGWYWRILYDAYNEGRLDEEYKRLILNEDQIDKYLKEGVIKETDFNEYRKIS